MSSESVWPSDAPLTDVEAITTVRLLQSVPAFVREPSARVARRALEAARKLKGIATIWLAIWPDGNWALLAHNPDWTKPRPEQLIRAYSAAHLAANFLRDPQASCGSTMLGGT